MTSKGQQTVFVGLSGGVDSAVAALRLQRQGYTVIGVFIKVWHPDFMVCNWEQERLDAMRVAAHLEIPFLTCNGEQAYKDNVADYFITEYKNGRTPNPDVMCNKAVKFGVFRDFALASGADYVATGHYVQRIENNGKAELHRGIDPNKDQSYFLWSLSQEQLDSALFPVGDTEKQQIRREAAKANIPVASKHDSQGICFLGHIDIPDFLSHYINLEAGAVLNEAGEHIGVHRGAFVYTIGQRHGFDITVQQTTQKPYYVVSKNVVENTITVATRRPTLDKATMKLSKLTVRDSVANGDVCGAQFRYRQAETKVTLGTVTDDAVSLKIEGEVETPSRGQSCVLYRGSHCIGGGIIE